MIPYVSKAQSVVEELKMYLEAVTIEAKKKKLDNQYHVLILRGMHPDYEHVRDQVLTSQEVPSMEDSVTRSFEVLHQKLVVIQ